ncbi:unnamed protein product [Ixodes hexagonus]
MALGRNIRCSSFLVSTLILGNISVAFSLPNHKLCVDSDCKNKLGVGLTVQEYHPGEASGIGVPRNTNVVLFAELEDHYEVEFEEKRGFVPKGAIRVIQQVVPKKDLVKVEIKKDGNVASASSKFDIYGTAGTTSQPISTPLPAPVEKSCLLYGTTMYGEMCDDGDATALSAPTTSLLDSNHGTVPAATTEQPSPTTASSWEGVPTVSPGIAVPPQALELAGGEVATSANNSEGLSNNTHFANFTAGDISENLVVGSGLDHKTESQPELLTKSEAESEVKTEPEPQEQESLPDAPAGTVQSEPQEQPQPGEHSKLFEMEEAAGTSADTEKDSDDQELEEEEEESAKPIPGEDEVDDGVEIETEDTVEDEAVKASPVKPEGTAEETSVPGSVSGKTQFNLTTAQNDELQTEASDLPQDTSPFLTHGNETVGSLDASALSPSPTVSVTSAVDSSTREPSVPEMAIPEKAGAEPLDAFAPSPSSTTLAASHSTQLHSSNELPLDSSLASSSLQSELLEGTSLGTTALFESHSESQKDTRALNVPESTQATIQESAVYLDSFGETQKPSISSVSSAGIFGQLTGAPNVILEPAATADEAQLLSSATAGSEGTPREAPARELGQSNGILFSDQKDPDPGSDSGLVGSHTESVVPSATEDVASTQSLLSETAMSTPSSVGETHTVTPQKRMLLQETGSKPVAMPPFNLGSFRPDSTETAGQLHAMANSERPVPPSDENIVLPGKSEEQAALVTSPSTTVGGLSSEVLAPDPPALELPSPESSAAESSAAEPSASGSSASGSSPSGLSASGSPAPGSPAPGSPASESSAPGLSAASDLSTSDLSAPGSSIPEAAAFKASAPETGAPGRLGDGSSAEKVLVEAEEDQKPALELYWAMAREYVFWILALVPEPLQAALEGFLPASSPQPGAITLTLLCGLLGCSVLTLYMRTCYLQRRKESSLTGTISSLEQRLFTLVTEKQVLTEHLEHARSQAETARSELQERDQQLKSLQEEGEELEICQRERDKAVRELRAALSEKTEQLEASQQLLVQKERQVSELEADAAWHTENEAALEEKLREATEQRLLWEEKAEEARASEKLLEVRLSEATQTGDHLWKELDALKRREKSLSADLEASVEEAAKTAHSLSEKEAELQALLKMVEQVQILQQHWESQEEKTEVEERLRELMDLAQVRQDWEQARELQRDLEARLEAQNQDLEARAAELASLRAELVESVRARDEAQRQSADAVTKLEVLSSYFKERELKLQREIGVQEVQRQQKEADVGSATQRLAMLEQQTASYRSQLSSLKQEMEVSERNYKNQLSEQEKRAHENWLAARAAERKLEDANRETATLRQRLTLLEREQHIPGFGPPLPPAGNSHMVGDTMPDGLNPLLPHGLLPPPPPLGPGGPPLPPPPLHPMMDMMRPPMFPPFPPPPPELLKRLRPSPGSFREDSPSPRSRDSRGSPPPLPHFMDPRGGPPFLPRPTRSHQASSTGSGDGRPHRSSPQSSGADSRRNGTGGNPSTAV